MRAQWRLAISTLSERRSRTALLVAVVALSAVLIAAVGAATGSLRHAVETRVGSFMGQTDVRVKPRGAGGMLDAGLSDAIRGWEGVEVAAPRLTATIPLRYGMPVWTGTNTDANNESAGENAGAERGPWVRSVRTVQVNARCSGIDPELDARVRETTLVVGRLPLAPREIVIDEAMVRALAGQKQKLDIGQLSIPLMTRASTTLGKQSPTPALIKTEAELAAAREQAPPTVGDELVLARFGKEPVKVTVVGIAAQPPLGGAPWCAMTLDGLREVTGQAGKVTRFDLILREGVDAEQFVARYAPTLPEAATLQTSERMTSNLEKNLEANQWGYLLASLMAFIAAGFIVMTGMSTGVTERLRELAVLRCIGASPAQLAGVQVLHGLLIGLIGACVGVPLGVLAAAVLIHHYHDKLQAEFSMDYVRVGAAFVGAVLAGLVGSAWPAFRVLRTSPLEALAVRAKGVHARTIWIVSLAGLACVALHAGTFLLPMSVGTRFYLYLGVGMPALMLGYFLLGVPVVLALRTLVGAGLERLLALPRPLLRRSVARTPYRLGFTSGAMMGGLAMLIAMWTGTSSVMRDWVDRIRFPDGFLVGLALPPEALDELKKTPCVTDTCAISLQLVDTKLLGVEGLMNVKTSFIGFDADAFFRMTKLEWVQGDEATARAALAQGGSVLVSREFLAARGVGMGDSFECADEQGRTHAFRVAGVVASPGLEVADEVFGVGQEYLAQRAHAVFGSREDLRTIFGVESVNFVQFSLDPKVSDEDAIRQVREQMADFGILQVASGRSVKETIFGVVRTAQKVISGVAMFALFVASFGVANLIVAGIQSRQFEFGVLRAVGAQRGLLARLVLGEACIVALGACVLGTCMGLQAAFGGSAVDKDLWGLAWRVQPPPEPIAWGWLAVIVMCLGAATPAVIALSRRSPRELLGAMRG